MIGGDDMLNDDLAEMNLSREEVEQILECQMEADEANKRIAILLKKISRRRATIAEIREYARLAQIQMPIDPHEVPIQFSELKKQETKNAVAYPSPKLIVVGNYTKRLKKQYKPFIFYHKH